MKNQLVLIADEPASGSGDNESRPASDSGVSPVRAPSGPGSKRPGGLSPRVRTHASGAAAARDALHAAVQRATAREEARRAAREAALLAAVTQPHLPLTHTRPGNHAA